MSVPQTTNAHDITPVIANLASRQGNRPKGPPMSGPKRAATLMLALGEQYGGRVWSLLDDDEVRELSMAMSTVRDRKSTRLNSSHTVISYAVFCLKKKTTTTTFKALYRTLAKQLSRP